MSTVALIDNFVANLETAIGKLGISQSELARRSGVHYVTVHKVLRRKMEPTVELCERLAEAAQMQPEKSFRKPA